jgi:hypothetical protein
MLSQPIPHFLTLLQPFLSDISSLVVLCSLDTFKYVYTATSRDMMKGLPATSKHCHFCLYILHDSRVDPCM